MCVPLPSFIGKLPATGGVWVIIGEANNERGSIIGQQNSCKTSSVVHSTTHLMHPNYIIYTCVCVYGEGLTVIATVHIWPWSVAYKCLNNSRHSILSSLSALSQDCLSASYISVSSASA